MKRKNTNTVSRIDITRDEITRLNDGYRRAEQARTNYYWISEVRDFFFRPLGVNSILEQIDKDIAEYLVLHDAEEQRFLSMSIQKCAAGTIDEYVCKLVSSNKPRRIDWRNVCEEHTVKKSKSKIAVVSEGIQSIVEYVEEQNFKFGAFSDDSNKVQNSISFVELLVKFLNENKSLLLEENKNNYMQFQLNYKSFKQTDVYLSFTQ